MKEIRIHEFGGPEVLSYEDVEIPEPGPGQARVKLAASGVNFIDIYQRTGLYPGDLQRTLGLEGAGEVDAVGEGVDDVSPGDYVAFASTPGSYAEYVVAPAENLVPFNATLVEPRVAAAAMLQGMTAHYLTHMHLPARGRPDGARTRGRRRRRASARPTREDAGGDRDRDGRHRGESEARQGGGGRRGHPLYRAGLRRRDKPYHRRRRRPRRLRLGRKGHLRR